LASSPKDLHYQLTNVGLRAQATATGFVQLCKELQMVGILSGDAVGRIKAAIADEVSLSAPRSVNPLEYRREISERLDRLFAGEKRLGDAEGMAPHDSAGSD